NDFKEAGKSATKHLIGRIPDAMGQMNELMAQIVADHLCMLTLCVRHYTAMSTRCSNGAQLRQPPWALCAGIESRACEHCLVGLVRLFAAQHSIPLGDEFADSFR